MELKQRVELRRLLVPELKQSLKILSLPLPELRTLVDEELLNNPLLEETRAPSPSPPSDLLKSDWDFRLNLLTKKTSLQDILLRQLGMFIETEEEFRILESIATPCSVKTCGKYLRPPRFEVAFCNLKTSSLVN